MAQKKITGEQIDQASLDPDLILPSQTGNTGKFLTTDGTDASWATVSGGAGTVTSVATGTGLTGGPVTTTGTISLDAASIASLALADTALQSGDNVSELVNDAGYTTNTGTVTSVTVTGNDGISVSGSPVTTSGTITLDLDNITPTSVAATGTVTGSNLSGTNTGDQTWIAPQVQTVTYSATPAINWTGKDVSKLTLTGNATITNSGAVDGQKMILQVEQGGSGSYTISFTSETQFGTDITAVTLSTAVGAIDMIGLQYSALNSKYNVVAVARGY